MEYTLDWNGIEIHLRYTPDTSGAYRQTYGYPLAHLEVCSPIPLPITTTGYRSHYTRPDNVAAAGGPVMYVRAWLDEESSSSAWKAQQQKAAQRSLFDE